MADLEIKLHNKFNFGVNEKFYNKAIQSSTGFDVSGRITVCDENGNTSSVPLTD